MQKRIKVWEAVDLWASLYSKAVDGDRLLEQLGLAEGSQVDVKVEGGRLVIEPARRRRMTMAELLEGFTPDDKPGEVDWGPPVGREVW